MSFTYSVAALFEQHQDGLLSRHATWERVTLGLVCRVQNGFAFQSKYFNTNGQGFPLLRIRDVTRGATETFYSGPFEGEYVVNPGDLVIGMDGDFNAKVWGGPPALLNQRVCRILPIGPHYSLRFLALIIQGYLDAVNGKTSAITVKHLSSRTIEELPLPLPPVAEQLRLVETIESYHSRLDDAAANIKRVQARIKSYRAAVLKAAVEGRLVQMEAELARAEQRDYEPAEVLLNRILIERRRRWEDGERARLKAAGKHPINDEWKAKYSEPPNPETTGLHELPEGWCWTSLGQAFNVTVGATPSRAIKEYWEGNIPWVSSGEVAFCRITDTDEKITLAGLENSSTKLNPSGSVLLGMIGEGKTRGQAAILDIDACGNQNSAAIWVSLTGIPPEYVYYYLLGQYERTRRRSSGNNQPALNKRRVEEIPLPLPPLLEQKRIVEKLDADLSVIDEVEAGVVRDLKRVSRLRQSVLKWAFEGKLVDQDPNDEPAQTLLERIQSTHVVRKHSRKVKASS